jgi:hypothetical protein
MKPYKNFGGRGDIETYDSAPDSVTIAFSNGWKYRYTSASAGSDIIEQMKALADAGQGLGTFINRVKPTYDAKWR